MWGRRAVVWTRPHRCWVSRVTPSPSNSIPSLRHRSRSPLIGVVVVGHSGETAEKSGSAQTLYNLRTHEAARAADLVWEALYAGGAPAHGPDTPGGLKRYPQLLAGCSLEELTEVAATTLEGSVARRFRHITSEAARVRAAIHYLGAGDLEAIGALFDASHQSLRNDYEVSTPALDQLVDTMRGGGAAGARLTGAGMGGCSIGICRVNDADSVLEAVQTVRGRTTRSPSRVYRRSWRRGRHPGALSRTRCLRRSRCGQRTSLPSSTQRTPSMSTVASRTKTHFT